MTTINVQVFSQKLEVVIRSPTHRVPTCDSTPLLIFSTIGEDNVCGATSCVRVFIDGVEVQVTRIGDAYGYDFYGADDLPYGFIPPEHQFTYGPEYGYGYSTTYGYGYGTYGYGYTENQLYGDPYGYGADDSYGYDMIPGTLDDTYGSDRLPGTLHIFQLPTILDGKHTLRVVVTSTSGLVSEVTECFIVDSTGPIITINSPANDTINPITECPILDYSIQDLTGLLSVNINIDGEDFGWLPSGIELADLKSGLHTITITAYDMATNACPMGNASIAATEFNLLKPLAFTEVPRFFYVGTDAPTQSLTADAVLEEMRILNALSTEADAADDFKILRDLIRFQLREGEAVLSPEETKRLMQLGVAAGRVNLPDNTLMLMHYDNTIRSEQSVGLLENPTNQVIDTQTASNRVDVTVKYNEGDTIDRELITELVERIVPAFVEVSITFEKVQVEG